MTAMNIVNPRLDWFVNQMRVKLARPKNVAKSDWRKMTMQELFARIKDEVAELEEALSNHAHDMDEDSLEGVLSECVDVADFCMMLADRARS